MARKQIISSTVFLAVLAAVGYVMHLLLPPPARWQLQGLFEILGITADSQRFWTISQKYDDEADEWRPRGPLQLRDMATGDVVAEYLKSEPDIFTCAMSPSGRFVVSHGNDNRLRLIDGICNVEHELLLDEPDEHVKWFRDKAIMEGAFPKGDVKFAPDEKQFQFRLRFTEQAWLIETTTGKIKRPITAGKEINYFLLDGSYCLSNTNTGHAKCCLLNLEKNADETDRLGAYTTFCDLSADLRFLVTKDQASNAAIWDLTNWQRKPFRAHANVKVSPGNRWLLNGKVLENHLQERTEVLDLATGKIIGQYQRDARVYQEAFSQDDSRCLLLQWRNDERPYDLEMVELPKGNVLWSKQLDANEHTPQFQFAGDGSVLLVFDNRIELWDGQTGVEKASIWRPSRWRTVNWLAGPNLTKHRNVAQFWGIHIAGEGWCQEWVAKWMPWLIPAQIVLIADANRGDHLFQVPCHDSGVLLTEDGRSLIVIQADLATEEIYGHRAYDIPARPRWGWVVGVPAGLCGTVLGLRALRRRSKAKGTTQELSGAPTS